MVEGGTAHGQGTITKINLCVMGCPLAPVYKGGRGEVRPAPRGAPGGVLLPLGVGLPPLALLEKERGRGKEETWAPPPPLPCPIRTRGEGARGLPWPPLLFSLRAHVGPLT